MNANRYSSQPAFALSLTLGAIASVCLAAATAASALTPRIAPQTQVTSVAVLSFQNESGVNAPAELGKILAQQLRQRLNTSYKNVVARALSASADSPGTIPVEQLIALGNQSGVRAVVRGGVLALDSETAADETKISVQLYADVLSVESGTVNTVRAEGVGQQKGVALGPLRIDAVALARSEFSTSALGLALSNAVEQLASLVYQSLTAQGPQSTPTSAADVQPVAARQDTQEDAALSADEELNQLIAQAEGLLSNPAGISSDSAASLNQAVRALKEALTSKAVLLEKAKDTAEADLTVAARKEELQAVLTRITTEATSAQATPGTVDIQPSGQKKNALARISEYLGETTNILQKIQELRATFRSANEDPSQYGGALTPAGAESSPPMEEATEGIEGVVTESGSPVEGVTVTDVESGVSATTDSGGSYTLNGVLAGKLAKLVLAKGGKQLGSGHVDVPRGRSGVADFELAAAPDRNGVRIISSSVMINAIKLRPGAKTGQLQGVVEDAQGKPVARALVQLKDIGVARTDSQGRYAFFNVPAGAHQFTVQGAGLRAASEQVQVSAVGSAERRVTLARAISGPVRQTLILRGAGTSLRGVVRDSDNRLVEGAKVTVLQGTQALSAVTGPQGSFELRDLKPASYRVVISKVGFESWSQTLELRGGRAEQSEVRLRKITGLSSLIAAQRALQGEIRGQVRWSSGEPVANALVEVKPIDKPYPVLKTVASPKGEYTVKVLEGRYEVKVKQGAQAISKLVVVRAGSASREDFALRVLDVAAVARAASGRLVTGSRPTEPAQQTALVIGRVTDARNGTPVPGVVVSIEGRAVRRSIRTDQRGDYSFGELPPDRYRVSVSSTSFSTEEKAVIARAAVSTRQDFALNLAMKADNRASVGTIRIPESAVLIRRGQISGRVIDSKTGRPVAGALVAVAGQRPVITDAQGGFVVSGLAPGNYRIGLTMRGYANGEGSVIVRSGETAAANFRLVPNPSPPGRLSRP